MKIKGRISPHLHTIETIQISKPRPSKAENIYASVMPFGRSVNPIPTGGGQIMPPNYYWPPDFFHLPASLYFLYESAGTTVRWKLSISTIFIFSTNRKIADQLEIQWIFLVIVLYGQKFPAHCHCCSKIYSCES